MVVSFYLKDCHPIHFVKCVVNKVNIQMMDLTKYLLKRKRKWCKYVSNKRLLYENIDQILTNKLHGPMHYKIGVTCVYNGHVFYTLL